MARQEIKVRSFVKFSGSDERIPMEEVNANPELRQRFDAKLKARLEAGLPNLSSLMKVLSDEAKIANT